MSTDKVAILISGTYREIEFLMDVFPEITQGIEHDIYIVLRHTSGELSRLGTREADFKLPQLVADNVFLCELPSMDKDEVKSRYLIPVGPTDEDREYAILGMFHGVFTAIQMMKSSLRKYDYVLKTRTDYLPPLSLPEMIRAYQDTGKIIVDGCASWARRYPDRLDIPWQGSLNDILCFADKDLFLKVWDFEDILTKVWTGIPETTLFRAAMVKLMGDDLQSPRRNDSFLKKYFVWDLNDTKQSFHVLRKRAGLPKPNEATYFKGDEVVKYFTDEKRVKGKVERAKLLKGFVPKAERVSKNFFTYKHIEGKVITETDTDTFSRFLEFMKENLWQPVDAKDFPKACEKFYFFKTHSRLDSFLKATGVSDKRENINGVKVPSCSDMLEDIDWGWLCDGIPCLFHGDPQPENIIVTKDGFCLLDWREDFAGLQYGDVYYDLAKIYHALIVSGAVIREGGYSIKENPVEFTLSHRANLLEFKDVLEGFIIDNGYDLKKVKVLSALIYLNIAPLHHEPYNRFLYYYGRKYLWELMEGK